MKIINFVIALSIVLSSNALIAQKVRIDTEKSTIEWLGKKLTGEHSGNILVESGRLEIDDNAIFAATFIIDMTSITNTDIEDEKYSQKLVGHLKSDDFFGVEKYPNASFVLKKSSEFKDGKATVSGDLTIKGKTESISFDVTRKDKEYHAKIEIDRSKFDVKYGSDSFFDNLGDKVIDDIFTLDVKLVTK